MNWNEELRSIGIGTLFVFFGKLLIAAALWYLLALVPIIIIIVVIS